MLALPEVGALSLEEKVGQTLCLGWQDILPGDARTLNSHARTVVQKLHAGSIVLLKRNVSNAGQIAGQPGTPGAMLAELQSLAAIPLLVSLDQEGGLINRFGPPLHQFPGNMALGAAQQGEKFAKQQTGAVARELRAIGVHWNCAPVVDVNNNPDNPVIGLRSFGEDPEWVARLGVAAVKGYQNAGLLACAKHFPGHGDTAVDSHAALPIVPHDRARIDAVELFPFRAVIAAGVGAIMTSHILFPALDPERPATLSPSILTDLLRNELGFEGLIITDCLEMEAIAGTVGTARGAVEALKAGADIALICHSLERQTRAFSAILEAARSGELPEARLNEAVGRVLAAKRRFLLDTPPLDVMPWHNGSHTLLERDIARAALTVVRNKGTFPLAPQAKPPLFFSAAPRDLLRNSLPNVELVTLDPRFPEQETADSLARVCGHEGAVLFGTAQAGRIDQEAQARIAHTLLRLCPNLIVVALESPYDLRHYPDVPNALCTYGIRPCNLEALADYLNGKFEATGHLPITLP